MSFFSNLFSSSERSTKLSSAPARVQRNSKRSSGSGPSLVLEEETQDNKAYERPAAAYSKAPGYASKSSYSNSGYSNYGESSYGAPPLPSQQEQQQPVQQKKALSKKAPAPKKSTARKKKGGRDGPSIQAKQKRWHERAMTELSTQQPKLKHVTTKVPKPLFPSFDPLALRLDVDAAKAAFEAAIKNGDAQEWGRAKLMLVGQGRAGKTSTVRSLLGLPFENTASTVGVDLKMTKAVDWQERSLQESDFMQQSYKAAVARYEEEQGKLHGVAQGKGEEEEGKKEKKRDSALRRLSKRISRGMSLKSNKQDSGNPQDVSGNGSPHQTNPRRSSALTEFDLEEEVEGLFDNVEEVRPDFDPLETTDAKPPKREQQKKQEKETSTLPLLREEDVAKEFDLFLVLKERDRKTQKESNIAFSIWDYGGQEVFYTLHHIFLTKFGVYMICFDMSEALTSPHVVIQYLKFWLNSIRLHAPESPFMIVGTFADKVSCPKQHKKIDEMLRKELKLARYDKLMPNTDAGIGFFPIDNSQGGGETIVLLRKTLEESVQNAAYIKQKVSLRWLKILEELMESGEPYLLLEEVMRLAETYGVGDDECSQMLSYYHELGVLVHLTATEELRKHVIITPQWLLNMLTLVINNGFEDGHARSAYDHEIRAQGLNMDYDRLRQEGIASRAILEFLWQEEPVDYLIDLMRSMMLLSDWKFSDGGPFYLIPSLVPPGTIKDSYTGPTCYLDFGEFFLPNGVFQRLLALMAEYSSQFEDSAEPILRQESACLSFGFTDFRLDVLRDEDRIRIIVDSQSGEVAKTIKLLVSMFRKLKDDVMKKLAWKLTIASVTDPKACVRYETAAEARDKGKPKVRGENRAVIKMQDVQVFFEDALEGSLVDDAIPKREATTLPVTRPLKGFQTHVFLSHKQSSAGDAVHTLFHQLSSRGFKCWFDQNSETVTKQTMQKGIETAAVYLLFLSKGVFDSAYVRFELETAMELRKPILFVHEANPDLKYAYCDFGTYISSAPPAAKRLFEEVQSIPYRRYRYEAEGMVRELESRILKSMGHPSSIEY